MVNLGLLDKAFVNKESLSFKPTDLQNVLFLFFKNGHSVEEFVNSPIPYILGVVGTKYFYDKKEVDSVSK